MRFLGTFLSVLIISCGGVRAEDRREPLPLGPAQVSGEEQIAYYGPSPVSPNRWSNGWWPPHYGGLPPNWQRQQAFRPYWYNRYSRGYQVFQGDRGNRWSGRRFGQPYYGNAYRRYGDEGRWYNLRTQPRWRNPPGFSSPYNWRGMDDARPWRQYGQAGWDAQR